MSKNELESFALMCINAGLEMGEGTRLYQTPESLVEKILKKLKGQKMNELISKELLSDVLGVEVVRIGEFNGSNLQVQIEHLEYADYYEIAFKRKNDWFSTINIHELAHKCKEWALKNSIRLTVVMNKKITIVYIKSFPRDSSKEMSGKDFPMPIKAETEPEAIFKACEWAREQL